MTQFWEIPGIIQNAKKEKQKQATNHVLNNNQCKLMIFAALSISCKASSSVNNVSFNYNDASLVAEIYWLVKIASCKSLCRSYRIYISEYFPRQQNYSQVQLEQQVKSTNNNFSFQATLCNQGQSISRPLKNVEFLEYRARVYPVK